MQREKTVAYTHALQYWVEKTDLPTGGQPCWLAKSVKELQEKMSCYLSFLDKEVFEGVMPPLEGMPTSLTEEAEPHSVTAMPCCCLSRTSCQERHLRNWPRRGSLLNFLDGKKCFTHPSLWWLLGQLPRPSRSQEWTYLLTADHNRHTRITPREAPSPTCRN